MSAVAAALQLPAADRSRLGRMQASVTLWVSTTDGSLLRHSLTITIPGASGTQTIETTIDLSDLDAPVTIAAP